MNNYKNNNNYIKNYFAFVLMVFAVFSGSNIKTILESAESGYSINFYAVKVAKVAHYNEYMFKLVTNHKLSLINNKAKSSIINFVKNSSVASILINVNNIFPIVIISAMSLLIYYFNNSLIKNNIWLRAVF